MHVPPPVRLSLKIDMEVLLRNLHRLIAFTIMHEQAPLVLPSVRKPHLLVAAALYRRLESPISTPRKHYRKDPR